MRVHFSFKFCFAIFSSCDLFKKNFSSCDNKLLVMISIFLSDFNEYACPLTCNLFDTVEWKCDMPQFHNLYAISLLCYLS